MNIFPSVDLYIKFSKGNAVIVEDYLTTGLHKYSQETIYHTEIKLQIGLCVNDDNKLLGKNVRNISSKFFMGIRGKEPY